MFNISSGLTTGDVKVGSVTYLTEAVSGMSLSIAIRSVRHEDIEKKRIKITEQEINRGLVKVFNIFISFQLVINLQM